jgi:hypothetical protein
VIEARIGLQAALNGDRTRDEYAAVPVSVEKLRPIAKQYLSAASLIGQRWFSTRP